MTSFIIEQPRNTRINVKRKLERLARRLAEKKKAERRAKRLKSHA